MANIVKLERLTRIGVIKGVPVYVHWSVILVSFLILFNAVRRPLVSVVGLVSYLAVLLLHECGHLIAAHRVHATVISIELYPLHGLCTFEMPWSRFDHALIAWGGVIAQLIVAIPLIIYIVIFGYTRFDAVNAVLAILGFFSVGMAAINLIPAGRLDGTMAWALFPEWLRRRASSGSRTRRY